MKKIIAISFFVLISIDVYSQFRETKWGDSQESVRKTESAKFIGTDKINGMQMIVFEGIVANLDTQIAYFFIENELVRAAYVFTETYFSGGQYVQNYYKIKDIINSVYGDPDNDLKNWNNETMKEFSDEVTAISLGDLSLATKWVTEDTKIGMTLGSKSFKTEHLVLYESLEHQDEIQSLNNKQAISDF